MKFKSCFTILALLFAVAFMSFGCTRVGPGYVGIKVNMAGDNRGVNDLAAETGWVWFNPFTESVKVYPVFVQTAKWTASPDEGKELNEEVSYNTKEGLGVSGDISLSYQLKLDKVPHFYVKFRSDDIEGFTHGYLRNVARDVCNEVASRFSVDSLIGPGKEKFLTEVRTRLTAELEPIGVSIEQFGFIGPQRPPENVITALNAKVAAVQQALQAENEVARTIAENRKKIEEARGDSISNRSRTASITSEILKMKALENEAAWIEKWNGEPPATLTTLGGGDNAFMRLPGNENFMVPTASSKRR